MKLSWLNTSEAHTNNTSMYMIWQHDAMHKVRESLEKVDQSLTHRYVSRFEHTALRLRLHTEGFSLTCPHRTPTQGTSTEDLGQYNREYTTPLLITNTTSTLEAMHNQHKHHLTKRGRNLANTNQSPHI